MGECASEWVSGWEVDGVNQWDMLTKVGDEEGGDMVFV